MQKLFAASLMTLFTTCANSGLALSETAPLTAIQNPVARNTLYVGLVNASTTYTMKTGDGPAMTVESRAAFVGEDGRKYSLSCKELDNRTAINNYRLDKAGISFLESNKLITQNVQYALAFDKLECKRLEM